MKVARDTSGAPGGIRADTVRRQARERWGPRCPVRGPGGRLRQPQAGSGSDSGGRRYGRCRPGGHGGPGRAAARPASPAGCLGRRAVPGAGEATDGARPPAGPDRVLHSCATGSPLRPRRAPSGGCGRCSTPTPSARNAARTARAPGPAGPGRRRRARRSRRSAHRPPALPATPSSRCRCTSTTGSQACWSSTATCRARRRAKPPRGWARRWSEPGWRSPPRWPSRPSCARCAPRSRRTSSTTASRRSRRSSRPTRSGPATCMLDFAAYTRHSLARHGDYTTVAGEFAAIEAYLALASAVLGEKLRVQVRIAPGDPAGGGAVPRAAAAGRERRAARRRGDRARRARAGGGRGAGRASA